MVNFFDNWQMQLSAIEFVWQNDVFQILLVQKKSTVLKAVLKKSGIEAILKEKVKRYWKKKFSADFYRA